ncbi:spore coat protein [Virgibacillus siamensis]|uniref:spore coat protein n=1 Tax=Virgibacillus siamensis TaxID=480071 RepID=UPI001FEA0818|nr:spore coat protein [Virgibacillus siamensis]
MSKSGYDNRSRSYVIEKRKAQSKSHHCAMPETCNCQQPESCSCHQQDSCPKEWNALDPTMCHPFDNNADITQQPDATLNNVQQSFDSIVIKDSCDVEVDTTDTQAAVNIQVAIQAAIALVISVSIADSDKVETITQELTSKLKTSQVNRQQTYIQNSRGVNVSTSDTDVAVNAQIALQVLIALVVRIGVL